MANDGRYAFCNRLDIEQILLEAQHRWLRPVEICEILSNYKRFHIAPEPPILPSSGSLFLFDRKVLRYFRKDGHIWRKKKDGKTVKEAHERLKSGSIDVLHCYYAHGEENENFQRRSYWMLEEEYSHIVFVHYREVKGNRTHFCCFKQAEDVIQKSQDTKENSLISGMDNSQSSSLDTDGHWRLSQNTDTTSHNSGHASEYEDADSAYSYQERRGYCSFMEVQQHDKPEPTFSIPYNPVPFLRSNHQVNLPDIPTVGLTFLGTNHTNDFGITCKPEKHSQPQSWEGALLKQDGRTQIASIHRASSTIKPDSVDVISQLGDQQVVKLFIDGFSRNQSFSSHPHSQENTEHQLKVSMDPQLQTGSAFGLSSYEQVAFGMNQSSSVRLEDNHRDEQSERITDAGLPVQLPNIEDNSVIEQKTKHFSVGKHFLGHSSKGESLKKNDSFNRWMSKELGLIESDLRANTTSYWSVVGDGNGVDDTVFSPEDQLDTFVLGPLLSQDQLFSIIDYSPNWAYAGSETKVLVSGKFLKNKDVEKCQWSCMFGEVEVPADVIADGVLSCLAPPCSVGRIPFYITCSDRVACSEVREFEYRVDVIRGPSAGADCSGSNDNTSEAFQMRLSKFLSVGSQNSMISDSNDILWLKCKIRSLIEEHDEWLEMLQLTAGQEVPLEEVKERLAQKLLKEKLYTWLLQKVAEGGKGPSILDEDGHGVLHFVAALGYDWAISPIIAAGVNVNFRDVRGWTALHWAAFCGREQTVAFLISQGAAAGALTDPNPTFRLSQTAADLASANGHKGIAGYLAELALSSHLVSLNLKDEAVDAAEAFVDPVWKNSEWTIPPTSVMDYSNGLSLKDSLAAVCNATQAAARIHQVFRVQSFQRKQMIEYVDDKIRMSDECALSMITLKTQRGGQHDGPVQAAAVQIQNKFRSWKGRKEFLTIRQQIVKIQAHVRGHQVRKTYKKFVWSVGIVEKVILRWRRKRSGLRGFNSDSLTACPNSKGVSSNSKVDEYDYLKVGKKQTEQRLQKALCRVKSMVQYPEARDQYHRLLTAVTEIKQTKSRDEKFLKDSKDAIDMDADLLDLEALLGDDTLMLET